jgi:hypothetical protein
VQNGSAVTFIVHASRDEDATTTVRLSVAAAVAKGRTLADEGWQVVITGPDGIRYPPPEFDKLLSLRPFSSESLPRTWSGVDTGSREENASKQKNRASVLIRSKPIGL